MANHLNQDSPITTGKGLLDGLGNYLTDELGSVALASSAGSYALTGQPVTLVGGSGTPPPAAALMPMGCM